MQGRAALRVREEQLRTRDHGGPPHEATEHLEIAAGAHASGDLKRDVGPTGREENDRASSSLESPAEAASRLWGASTPWRA
jgi:hypothetical protein